jgi:hypothetical protein
MRPRVSARSPMSGVSLQTTKAGRETRAAKSAPQVLRHQFWRTRFRRSNGRQRAQIPRRSILFAPACGRETLIQSPRALRLRCAGYDAYQAAHKAGEVGRMPHSQSGKDLRVGRPGGSSAATRLSYYASMATASYSDNAVTSTACPVPARSRQETRQRSAIARKRSKIRLLFASQALSTEAAARGPKVRPL